MKHHKGKDKGKKEKEKKEKAKRMHILSYADSKSDLQVTSQVSSGDEQAQLNKAGTQSAVSVEVNTRQKEIAKK